MRGLQIFLSGLCACFLLVGCYAKQPENSEATPTPEAALQMIQKQPDLVILDVRTPEEYAQNHLEKAQLFNLRDPQFRTAIDKLDRNQAYLVYCQSGNRSARAVKMLHEMGFKRVYDLKGGMQAWLKAKGPVQ